LFFLPNSKLFLLRDCDPVSDGDPERNSRGLCGVLSFFKERALGDSDLVLEGDRERDVDWFAGDFDLVLEDDRERDVDWFAGDFDLVPEDDRGGE